MDYSYPDSGKKALHLYTKVPYYFHFPYEASHNPIPFFLPNYRIEVLKFEEFPETFTLKEKTRCRYNCSVETKECETLECWDRPFLCFGNAKECWKHDGKGLCKIALEETKTHDDESDKEFVEKSSIDFGEQLLFGYFSQNIDDKNFVQIPTYANFFWRCSVENEFEVLCVITNAVAGASSQLLKTIAG